MGEGNAVVGGRGGRLAARKAEAPLTVLQRAQPCLQSGWPARQRQGGTTADQDGARTGRSAWVTNEVEPELW